MGYTDSKVFDTILRNVYGITLGIDIGTDMGFFDVSFDDCNDDKLEGLLIEGSLVSADGKIIGYDEGITLGSTYSKVLVTMIEM